MGFWLYYFVIVYHGANVGSVIHSGIPPPSLFWLDLVLLVSRFLFVGFTENDLERCGVGFFQDLVS